MHRYAQEHPEEVEATVAEIRAQWEAEQPDFAKLSEAEKENALRKQQAGFQIKARSVVFSRLSPEKQAEEKAKANGKPQLPPNATKQQR